MRNWFRAFNKEVYSCTFSFCNAEESKVLWIVDVHVLGNVPAKMATTWTWINVRSFTLTSNLCKRRRHTAHRDIFLDQNRYTESHINIVLAKRSPGDVLGRHVGTEWYMAVVEGARVTVRHWKYVHHHKDFLRKIPCKGWHILVHTRADHADSAYMRLHAIMRLCVLDICMASSSIYSWLDIAHFCTVFFFN